MQWPDQHRGAVHNLCHAGCALGQYSCTKCKQAGEEVEVVRVVVALAAAMVVAAVTR